MCLVFQSWCTMTCLQSGKPSGRPSVSLLVTLSCSLPWRWWRFTGTSSWRTTWTSLTSLSSLTVKKHVALQLMFTYISSHLCYRGTPPCNSACQKICTTLSVCDVIRVIFLECGNFRFIAKSLQCKLVAGNLKDVSNFPCKRSLTCYQVAIFGNCRNQHWLIQGTSSPNIVCRPLLHQCVHSRTTSPLWLTKTWLGCFSSQGNSRHEIIWSRILCVKSIQSKLSLIFS